MIKLTVTPAAADWIKETLKLVVGNGVKFYPDPDNHHPVIHGPHQLYAIDNHPDRVVAKDEVSGINCLGFKNIISGGEKRLVFLRHFLIDVSK